jgi:hypothetical protein
VRWQADNPDPPSRKATGDDRKLYEDSSYPWCCIGQVSCRNGNSTGTLALKNFFVTASHAVAALWQNGQPLTESICPYRKISRT